MATVQQSEKSGFTGKIDRFFQITQRGSTLAQEIRGGLVTFFAMSYIVVLNPLILGTEPDGTGMFLGGGSEPNLAAVAAGTALAAGVLTILMGLVANFPLALAAGLGLNAIVAFSIAGLPDVTWADAMGIVVLEGIIILVLVMTGFREAVFKAVPAQLKTAISVGIGLFIALVGFVNSGFVRPGVGGTPLELGVGGFLAGWPTLVFVFGLGLIVVLMVRKVRGAILIGIVVSTALAVVIEAVARIGEQTDDNLTGWGMNVPALPDTIVQTPDFSTLGEFSLLGSIDKVGIVTVILLVFTLMLADFFDTMGTMVAIGGEAKLLDKNGNPPRTKQILIVDSLSAAAGGVAGVSSNTSFVESASGVGEGARTGLANIVTGVMFLFAVFLAPLVSMVPYEAATPALVVVGFLMMTQVVDIDWRDMSIAIPAFLTMVVMPFTYSISAGIGMGFLGYVILRIAKGKTREIHPLMWVISALFVVYFAMDPVRDLLGV